VPDGWTDNPQGFVIKDEEGNDVFNGTYYYEWVCTRKRTNGEWKPFEGVKNTNYAALWSRYSVDGVTPSVPITIFAFAADLADTTTAPTGGGYILNEETGLYESQAPTGWSLEMPDSGIIYCTTGVFSSIDGAVIKSWSIPTRLSGTDTSGGSGGEGTDNKVKEYIYKSSNTKDPEWLNDIPTNKTDEDDFVPGKGITDTTSVDYGWLDNPSGLNETDSRYIYFRFRTKEAGSTTWSNWCNPARLWAAYGEKGQDGDGVEYIFTRTTGNVAPAIPTCTSYESTNSDGTTTVHNSTDDDYAPAPDENGVTWTDDP